MKTAWFSDSYIGREKLGPLLENGYRIDKLSIADMNGQLPNYDLIIVDIKEGGIGLLEETIRHAHGTHVVVAGYISGEYDRRIPQARKQAVEAGAIGLVDLLEARTGHLIRVSIDKMVKKREAEREEQENSEKYPHPLITEEAA